MSKYHEIMDHIYVTQDIHDRVLSGIRGYFLKSRKAARRARIYSLSAVAAAAVIICGVGLWRYGKLTGTPSTDAYESENVADVFAVTDCVSIDELSGIVGFDIPELSSLPFEVQEISYTAFGSDLAQVRYIGAGECDVLTYRKSPGTEDNSGDYNAYSESEIMSIDGLTVQLKGKDGLIYLACWNDGEYAYSVSAASGLTRDELTALVYGALGKN